MSTSIVELLPAGACLTCEELHECDVCHDSGRVPGEWVIRHNSRVRETVPCPACTSRWPDSDARIGIPVAYRGIDPTKLRLEQRTFYHEFARDDWARPLAVVTGPSGTGKTTAVAACARAVATRGHSVRFYTVSALVERFRATYNRPMDEEMASVETVTDIHAQLARVWLLILDDWGQHRRTDMGAEQLFRIVADRINGRQNTIITTNMADAYFRAENPALHSRMFGSDADVSVFGGRDLRK